MPSSNSSRASTIRIAQVCIVADRSMISAATIAALEKAGAWSIEHVPSLSCDPVVVRSNWQSAYTRLTDRGLHFASE